MSGARDDARADARADVRRAVPEVVRQVAQVVMDNPGQCALLIAAALTAAAAARNLVRPRTLAEAIALFVVLDAGCSYGAAKLIEHQVITFRIRGPGGELVPWRPRSTALPGDGDAGRADPAA